MECSPRLDSQPRTRLRSIPGTVPAPRAYPSHCRYADRCPIAEGQCRAGPIPLLPVGSREVRCIKVQR